MVKFSQSGLTDRCQRLSGETFDVVIIGGGIFGALLAVEGAARGQRVVLLERGDFGGGTSFNSLRTIHGGLRYLQSLDLARSLSSNAQRLWWLRRFPDLVVAVSCLMPLYGEGLRRPLTFRGALLLARLLGLGRDAKGVPHRSEIMSADKVRHAVPSVKGDGLQGGATWADAFMPQSHRVIVECLHWAEQNGALLANYTEVVDAEPTQGAWQLTTKNTLTGETCSVSCDKVINATGPDVDAVAGRLTRGKAEPVLIPTLAFNLLLKRPPPSAFSIAAKPPGSGRGTYFVHPYHDDTLAGTGHSALSNAADVKRGVDRGKIDDMLQDLNEALPGLGLNYSDVRHVFWGILPGAKAGSDELLMRPLIVDHGARHGIPNAWSILGVKFTEAPSVARRTWDAILGPRRCPLPSRPEARHLTTASSLRLLSEKALNEGICYLYDEEWCCTPDDLIWRRTDLWTDGMLADRARAALRSGRPHGTGGDAHADQFRADGRLTR